MMQRPVTLTHMQAFLLFAAVISIAFGFLGPAPAERSDQIHPVVVLSCFFWWELESAGRCTRFLINDDVNSAFKRVELTGIFSECYREEVGRGSSVVEQPIRNRQVESSTLSLGSIYFL